MQGQNRTCTFCDDADNVCLKAGANLNPGSDTLKGFQCCEAYEGMQVRMDIRWTCRGSGFHLST